jgi:hypothetical protein
MQNTLRNFGDIIAAIYGRMHYNPKLKAYRDHVEELINEKYLALCRAEEWLFLHRTATFSLYARITGTTTGTTIQPVGAAEPRQVQASAGLFSGWMLGPTLRVNAKNYTIAAVVSSTVATLTEAYVGPATATTGWEIRFTRYLLPQDLADILSFKPSDSFRSKLSGISALTADLTLADTTDLGTPALHIEDDHLTLRAPYEPPTVTNDAAPGALVTGRTYAYMYTFERAGRESAPSPVAEVKLTGGNTSILVAAMEDTLYAPTTGGVRSALAGTSKNIYRRDLTRKGPWRLVAQLADAVTSTVDSVLINTNLALDEDQVRIYYPAGPRRTVRFDAEADEDTTMTLRYTARPVPMVATADEPLIPVAHRPVLVHATLLELFSQIGDKNNAALQTALLAQAYELLEGSEKNRADIDHRFRRRDHAIADRWSRRFGTPTITA